MLFRYPNNSTEVRNLDWYIKTVEELQQKVDNLMSDKLEEAIDDYFNKVMITAIYDEENERIILSKEAVVSDGVHIYSGDDNSITIEGV